MFRFEWDGISLILDILWFTVQIYMDDFWTVYLGSDKSSFMFGTGWCRHGLWFHPRSSTMLKSCIRFGIGRFGIEMSLPHRLWGEIEAEHIDY